MDEYAVEIAGLPARAGLNTDGFFANVTFVHVFIYGSPLVVTINPPVATIEQVSLPATLVLAQALVAGAVVHLR